MASTEGKFEFNWHGQNNWFCPDFHYKFVNWESILDTAKQINKGQDCDFNGRYHAGGNSVVRRLRFRKTGEQWLVKVPVFPGWYIENPNVAQEVLNAWSPRRRERLKSEIATMRYVAQHSKIPVPTVYGYNTAVEGNPAKLPYILMQCLEGNILYEHPNYDKRSDAEQAKIEKTGAWIQHQLSTMVTSKICAIQLNEDGSFFEGPFICADDVPEDIFKGPYSSVSEYLVNWAKVWREKMKDRIGIKPHAEGLKYPSLLRILEDFPTMLLSSIKNADQFLEYYGKGGNTLVHGDFSYHNHLYNDDYDLVGVIDFEHCFTAPWPLAISRTVLDLEPTPWPPVISQTPVLEDCVAEIKHSYAEELRKIESPNKRLSEVYSNPLGEIGWAMDGFSHGHVFPKYSEIIARLDHAIKAFNDVPPPSSSSSSSSSLARLVTEARLDKVK